MAKIEFGISLRQSDNVVEEAREAETQGYDFLTAGEHMFFHGPTTNGLITLAGAAAATTRIRLMTSITLIPLYPAAVLAKQIATLDRLSGGRFNLGVGVGGEYPKEFEACGVPVNQRGPRTDESLDVMIRLWTEDNVTYDGRFNKLSGVTLIPKPIQKPPPIWVSGRSDGAMKRTARFAQGWIPYMYTPEMLQKSVDKITGYSEGRDSPVNPGIYLFFAVHEDPKRALKMCSEQLSTQYNQDFSKLVGKYALSGTPDQCIARLNEYVESGAKTVILSSACPADYMEENQRLLAKTVLPAFTD